MTNRQIDIKIARLKNQIERATQKPDPYGTIRQALRDEIARLEAMRNG